MRGSPLIPRAEMRLWVAGRGADLILKDEWRPNQRSLSFPPPPGPVHPCAPTPIPYPASLPCFSASRLHLYMHAKSPRLLPHLGWGSRGPSHAIRYGAISRASRCCSGNRTVTPWVPHSGGTPVRVRAVQCRARARCRERRTGGTRLPVRRAGSAAWRSSRA